MNPRQKATSSSTVAQAAWSTSIRKIEGQREWRSADRLTGSAKLGHWTEESGDADALLRLIARPALAVVLL
jgi:hypothetical protein